MNIRIKVNAIIKKEEKKNIYAKNSFLFSGFTKSLVKFCS